MYRTVTGAVAGAETGTLCVAGHGAGSRVVAVMEPGAGVAVIAGRVSALVVAVEIILRQEAFPPAPRL